MRCLVLLTLALTLFADDRSDAADRILASLRSTDGPGCAVAVVHRGKLLYSAAFGLADLESRTPISLDTRFNIASMSKQFTAAALYFLVADGRVHTTDSVRRFIPELPRYGDAITVADLLHHTSGLRDSLLELAGKPEPFDATGHLRLLAAQSALNFTPGADYEYTNSDYILLSIIVERVSGMPLPDFAAERIFRPLGMSHTGYYPGTSPPAGAAAGFARVGNEFRNTGTPPLTMGDGGVYTTIEDLLRWDENFSTGKLGGPPFLRFMERPGRLRSGERIDYAAGLVITDFRGLRAVGHDGALPGYHADWLRLPERRLSVISLCNRGDAEPETFNRRIAATYLGSGLKGPRHAADLDYATTDFPQLDGAWESSQGWLLRAWSSVDGLTIETGGGVFKLASLNRRQLFSDDAGFRLTLTRLAADRFALQWDGEPPRLYRRLPTEAPHLADLDAYTGDYHSPDVGANWRMIVESGNLTITTTEGWRIPLDPVAPDRFAVGPWSLHFLRDSAGRLNVLELHRQRLWNLRFERTTD